MWSTNGAINFHEENGLQRSGSGGHTFDADIVAIYGRQIPSSNSTHSSARWNHSVEQESFIDVGNVHDAPINSQFVREAR